jgi:hypothetical protein
MRFESKRGYLLEATQTPGTHSKSFSLVLVRLHLPGRQRLAPFKTLDDQQSDHGQSLLGPTISKDRQAGIASKNTHHPDPMRMLL